jgi:hypothetical protein
LAALINLQVLNLSVTEILSVLPLTKLTRLEEIFLEDTKIPISALEDILSPNYVLPWGSAFFSLVSYIDYWPDRFYDGNFDV